MKLQDNGDALKNHLYENIQPTVGNHVSSARKGCLGRNTSQGQGATHCAYPWHPARATRPHSKAACKGGCEGVGLEPLESVSLTITPQLPPPPPIGPMSRKNTFTPYPSSQECIECFVWSTWGRLEKWAGRKCMACSVGPTWDRLEGRAQGMGRSKKNAQNEFFDLRTALAWRLPSPTPRGHRRAQQHDRTRAHRHTSNRGG